MKCRRTAAAAVMTALACIVLAGCSARSAWEPKPDALRVEHDALFRAAPAGDEACPGACAQTARSLALMHAVEKRLAEKGLAAREGDPGAWTVRSEILNHLPPKREGTWLFIGDGPDRLNVAARIHMPDGRRVATVIVSVDASKALKTGSWDEPAEKAACAIVSELRQARERWVD